MKYSSKEMAVACALEEVAALNNLVKMMEPIIGISEELRMETEHKLDIAAEAYPICKYFKFTHLPEKLQSVSSQFAQLALIMSERPRNAETSAGLRKLLEAKDCAVRAAL